MKLISFNIILFIIATYCSDGITAASFQVQTSVLNRHQGLFTSRICNLQHNIIQKRHVVSSHLLQKRHTLFSNNIKGDSGINNQRRKCLQSIITFTTASSIILPVSKDTQKANAAQTTGEAIRRSAANIPGYGQADVFYPNSYIGKWKATRVIVSLPPGPGNEVYFPLTAATASSLSLIQEMLPLTITYDIRFITVDGDLTLGGRSKDGYGGKEVENEKVIADRQFNEESLYNALRNVIIKKMDDFDSSSSVKQKQPPSIQTLSWSPSNPNVLITNYNDGSSKEIKVTKRAAELDISNGIVSSSEYRRVTTISGDGVGGGQSNGMLPGIPFISASRVLNKWKISSSDGNGSAIDLIEGIEIIYNDGMVGDPMAANRQQQPQQQLICKSRIRLERL